jgi:putative ABC transport system permease protein
MMLAVLRRFTSRHHVLFGIWEAMGMGLQGIRAYKMRAFLTILGVVMGIMTVTGMSSIVAGLNASMARQIASLGSSAVFIRPFKPGERRTDEEIRRAKGVTLEEVERIAARPAVKVIVPLQIVFADSVKYGTERARDTVIIGTTEAYEEVHDTWVERGRFISRLDVNRGAKVVVLGADIVDALFPYLDPIDKEVTIDGRRFKVIGALERKGKFLWQSMDNYLFIPVNSLVKKNQEFDFLFADLKPISPAHIDQAIDQTRETMRRYRKLKYLQKDNFVIFTQDAITEIYTKITGGIYLVMIAISSIGLLVGGVGVMNIMLVSVTERTREIGVRKALGATKRDILWQFLTEAMTLTGTGGLIGIVIGGGAASLINAFSPFPAVVQPTWVTIAFATAVGVGLTFGLWPAAKAAGLDPIEALRYE